MQEYDSTVTIDMPPDKVWAILTDGSGYQQWNPEIVAIDGTIAAAARSRSRGWRWRGVPHAPSHERTTRVAHSQERREPPAGDRSLLCGAQATGRVTLGPEVSECA